MKIQVKPIGYKFRVTNNDGVFDIESTTELSMAKSDEIIRKFFDNFIIIKSDIRVSSADIVVSAKSAMKNEEKRSVDNGSNSTMKNIMRSDRRTVQPPRVRQSEKSIRLMRRNADKSTSRFIEKKTAKIKEKKAAKIKENKPVTDVRESVKNKWRRLGGSLKDEFTLQEYIKSLKDAGYEYTELSWEAVPSQQISRLIELGEVEKIGRKKPFLYRKIKISTNEKSERQREILKI